MTIIRLNFRFSSVQVSLPCKRVDTLSWSLFQQRDNLTSVNWRSFICCHLIFTSCQLGYGPCEVSCCRRRRWWSDWLSQVTLIFDSESINSLPPSHLAVCYYTGWGGEGLDECLRSDIRRYFSPTYIADFSFRCIVNSHAEEKIRIARQALSLNVGGNVVTNITHNFNFITRLLL